MKIFVENLINNNGNAMENQYVIHVDYAEYLQSYRSMVAKKERGKCYIARGFLDYSRTTDRAITFFFGMKSKNELMKAIRSGQINLVDHI